MSDEKNLRTSDATRVDVLNGIYDDVLRPGEAPVASCRRCGVGPADCLALMSGHLCEQCAKPPGPDTDTYWQYWKRRALAAEKQRDEADEFLRLRSEAAQPGVSCSDGTGADEPVDRGFVCCHEAEADELREQLAAADAICAARDEDVARAEDAIRRAMQVAVDEDIIGSSAFAILQGVMHDGIPSGESASRVPYDPEARHAAAVELEWKMGLSPRVNCIYCTAVEGHERKCPAWRLWQGGERATQDEPVPGGKPLEPVDGASPAADRANRGSDSPDRCFSARNACKAQAPREYAALVRAAVAVIQDARDQGRDDCMDDLVDEQHIEVLRNAIAALDAIADNDAPADRPSAANEREAPEPLLADTTAQGSLRSSGAAPPSKMACAWAALTPFRDGVDVIAAARELDGMFDRVRRETIEACAKLCDGWVDNFEAALPGDERAGVRAAKFCAESIRRRAEPFTRSAFDEHDYRDGDAPKEKP